MISSMLTMRFRVPAGCQRQGTSNHRLFDQCPFKGARVRRTRGHTNAILLPRLRLHDLGFVESVANSG